MAVSAVVAVAVAVIRQETIISKTKVGQITWPTFLCIKREKPVAGKPQAFCLLIGINIHWNLGNENNKFLLEIHQFL